MSLEAEIKSGGLNRGKVRYFPVVPGKLEFALELRKLLLDAKPGVVAVELPGFLASCYQRALARLPEMSVILYHDDDGDDRAIYIPVEPCDPFVEALRTAEEIGAQVIFLEPDSAERPHLPDTYPDTYATRRIGLDPYIEAYRVYPQMRTEEVTAHASAMAWKLQGADPEASVVAVVALNMLDPLLDAMETPQAPPGRGKKYQPELLNPHPDCLAEITIEFPYLQERYEFFRLGMSAGPYDDKVLDRPRVQFDLMREAEGKYTLSTGEKLAHWQRRMIARFTRNLAHITGDLVASVYDLAVAARSVVDDNYGWEVWQMANRYLAQHEVSDLDTVRLECERDLDQYQAAAHPAAASAGQAALETGGFEAAQAREIRGRVGGADYGRGHLFLSAGGSGDRGIRALRQAKGQGDFVGRARAGGAVHDFDTRRHRHSRDHSQLAPA